MACILLNPTQVGLVKEALHEAYSVFRKHLVEGVIHMDNVINLFSRRAPAKAGQTSRGGDSGQQSSSAAELNVGGFSDVAERNRQNQQRLRKEREQANKNVLKSYRIK